MRVGVAAISMEAGSFLGEQTTIEHFKRSCWGVGHEADTLVRNSTELGGVMAVLDAAPEVEPVPLMAATALPYGPLTREARQTILQTLDEQLTEAGELEALCLVLHGALIADDDPDVEGTLLALARGHLPNGTIGASLDSHAHITSKMVEYSDFLTTYRTVPHVDQLETGSRLARRVLAIALSEVRPVMSRRWIPMITPAETHDTSQTPMLELAELRSVLEALPGVLDCSLAHVQPWIDVPGLGWVVLAVTDDDHSLADHVADMLADAAWAAREAFLVSKVPVADAVAQCATSPTPVVVSDSGDNTGGGAAGDSTVLISAVLAMDKPPVSLLTVTDPTAADLAHRIGIGALHHFELGGWSGALGPGAVALQATVRDLPSGHLVVLGPSQTGAVMDLGRTAILQHGTMTLVVSENPLYNLDPSLFVQLGLNPEDYQLIHTKSPAGYRAGYASTAPRSISIESPGPTTSEFHTLPWRHISRPLFPLDTFVSDAARPPEPPHGT